MKQSLTHHQNSTMGRTMQRPSVIVKTKVKKEEPKNPGVKRIGAKKTASKGEKESPEKSAGGSMTGLRGNVRRICDNFFKVILWLQLSIIKGNPLTVIGLQVGQP